MHSGKALKTKTYEPNHVARLGIRVWPEMISEIISHRELVWRLIVRDIRARYRQSFLGVLWAFLPPLAMTVILVWAKERHILSIKNTVMPYAAFVFYGQMIWLLFAQGIETSACSLVSAGSLVTKINFPREVLIFSALGQVLFQFLVRMPLLIVVFLWVGFTPKWTILFVPIGVIPLILMTTGIGFMMSIFNAVVRDVGNALGILMTFAMFATPVIYPAPAEWPSSFLINYVNPVSPFLAISRDLAVVGVVTDPASYVAASLIGLVVFFTGWRVFHALESKIAERI